MKRVHQADRGGLQKGLDDIVAEPAEGSRRQLRLCVRNMCALADNFADNGILPIVEYPIDRPELPEFVVGLLRAAPVMFVVLAPPLEVCRERNAARPARERVDFDCGPQYRAMREQLGGVGWWLANSGRTPEQTADLIAAHARDRALIPTGSELAPVPCARRRPAARPAATAGIRRVAVESP